MTLQNEGNPSEHDSLAAEVQRGFDESGKLPERLIRYAFARDRAVLNLTQIDYCLKKYYVDLKAKGGTSKGFSLIPFVRKLQFLRIRLRRCGSYLVFKDYYTQGKTRLSAADFCMAHLLCPLCAIRRGSKTLTAYLQRFEIIKAEHPNLKLSMLTLTVKNGDDLHERFHHLRESISTMLLHRRRSRNCDRGWHSEFAKIAGLVGTIEVTKDGGKGEIKETGWHPHAHIMVLHDELFDYAELQAEWLKITGDSHVLNVTPAQHPENPSLDFLEVFKYAVKFSSLTPEQNLEAFAIMGGHRLLFSAGLFWGVKVPESNLDEELANVPYHEMFYKYLPGKGYNLTKTRHSDGDQDKYPEPWEEVNM